MSRTHFKQTVGELVDSQISTSKSFEPVNPKLKLKTKTGLAKEGDITIRGVITKIFIFKGKSYSINKLHKEKSGSKDLKY